MIAQGDLIEDPDDFIAGHLSQMAGQFFVASKEFYASTCSATALSFCWSSAFCGASCGPTRPLAALGAYQVCRCSYTHSPGLLALTLFDAVVMVPIWHERRVLHRRRAG